MAQTVLLVPIPRERNTTIRLYYQEQQLNQELTNNEIIWNDIQHKNEIREGDICVFVHNYAYVTIHRVVRIDVNHGDRLPEWADHIGQSCHVLYLSNEISRIPWNDWGEFGGYVVRRTMYVEKQALKTTLLQLFDN
jgi:hypothetical protein